MLVWLAIVAAMAVAGWFTGQGLYQSALAEQDAAEAQQAKRERIRAKRESFPANSPEGQWMEKVRNATAQDFENLCKEWYNTFEWNESYEHGYPPNALNALRWVMGKWLTADLAGFLEKAPSLDDYWAADVLVELMPQEALNYLLNDSGVKVDKYFASSVLYWLVKRNPELLVGQPLAELERDRAVDDEKWHEAIESLAKSDAPMAASITSIIGIGSDEFFHELLLRVARNWKEGDPPITDWLDSLEDPRMKYLAHHAHWNHLSESDPEAAMDAMMKGGLSNHDYSDSDSSLVILKRYADHDPLKAIRLLKEIEDHLVRCPDHDPFDAKSPAYLAWMAANPFSHHSYGPETRWEVEEGDVRFELVESMAKHLPDDPVELLNAVRKMNAEAGVGDAAWQQRLEGAFLQEKAKRWSVDQCLFMARQWQYLPDEDGFDVVLWALGREAAERDPYQALERIQDFPEAERGYFMSEIAKRLPASDEGTLFELLQQLPGDEWDGDHGSMIARDPETYSELLSSRASTVSRSAISAFSYNWAEADPQAVAEWSLALPAERGMHAAIDGLMDSWMEFDADAAMAWVGGLQKGTALDAASVHLVNKYRWHQQESAWQWANAISDPERRARNYDRLAEQWKNPPEEFVTEHAEARRAIGQAPFEKEVER